MDLVKINIILIHENRLNKLVDLVMTNIILIHENRISKLVEYSQKLGHDQFYSVSENRIDKLVDILVDLVTTNSYLSERIK